MFTFRGRWSLGGSGDVTEIMLWSHRIGFQPRIKFGGDFVEPQVPRSGFCGVD